MHKTFTRMSLIAFGVAATVSLNSCVDHDYDLTEDIDLTLQLGGNLSLPASSTDILTLSQILDLKDDSSIKTAKTDGQYGLKTGDYALVQDGSSEPAEFEVEKVDINGLSGSTSTFELPQFDKPGFLGDERITRKVTNTVNSVSLSDDNVTDQIVSLSYAEMDVEMILTVEYRSDNFASTAYIEKGYTAVFDPSWTVEIIDAPYLESVDNHTLRFTQEYGVTPSHPLNAKIRLVAVDFSEADADQGLYERGKFRMESEVNSSGDVSILASDLPVGHVADLELVTKTNVEKAVILSVTGVVDPEINVEPTSFAINDIPDFLSDDANNLDVENPQINFTVHNTSPLTIDVNAILTSYYSDGKAPENVEIGEKYGTSAIVVAPNGTTNVVISRKPISTAGVTNVVVPDLGKLIETIPDEINFHDISCEARPDEVTFRLGDVFTFDATYEAVIPLAFGENMALHYTHEDLGWDEDLEKYNFNEVLLSFDAVNTLPLAMTPKVIGLGHSGQELTDITATVEGTVQPGTMASPSTTSIKVTLKSTAANIKELDGVRLVFDAVTADGYTGVNLNEGMSLKFDNIKVKIVGGVIVDLND